MDVRLAGHVHVDERTEAVRPGGGEGIELAAEVLAVAGVVAVRRMASAGREAIEGEVGRSRSSSASASRVSSIFVSAVAPGVRSKAASRYSSLSSIGSPSSGASSRAKVVLPHPGIPDTTTNRFATTRGYGVAS